jgi:DNA polymerase bacteriophage-type
VGAWRKLAPEDASTDAEIKQRQARWRKEHPKIKAFWDGLDRAAIAAVRNPDQVFRCQQIAFRYDSGTKFLQMKLPSTRNLTYPFAELITNNFGHPAVSYMAIDDKGKWAPYRYGQGMYGGLFCENVVQAIARDVFAEAMLRLEAAGYPIVLHVHDEIVAEVPNGFGSADAATYYAAELGERFAARREGSRRRTVRQDQAAGGNDGSATDTT